MTPISSNSWRILVHVAKAIIVIIVALWAVCNCHAEAETQPPEQTQKNTPSGILLRAEQHQDTQGNAQVADEEAFISLNPHVPLDLSDEHVEVLREQLKAIHYPAPDGTTAKALSLPISKCYHGSGEYRSVVAIEDEWVCAITDTRYWILNARFRLTVCRGLYFHPTRESRFLETRGFIEQTTPGKSGSWPLHQSPGTLSVESVEEAAKHYQTSTPPPSSEDVLKSITDRLVARFDLYLAEPKEYRNLVNQTCNNFPEGDLFPYVYPAMAYVNLALREPRRKKRCIRQARKLLDLAIHSVTERVNPPAGDLANLRNYGNHATYLGQLNLALGAYSLISDDTRYDTLHTRLSDIFHQALVQTAGRPLRSFPEYAWPFDTIPVLLSLQLYDAKTGKARSRDIIGKHLAWVRKHATDPELGLPYSRIDLDTGEGLAPPRGCDLSFRLCLLPHVDSAYARELYEHYTRNFWLDRGVLAGFAEWPNGTNLFEDMDSGPIVMGIGLGATGLGFGATIALEDSQRLDRLCGQLAALDSFRPLFKVVQDNAAKSFSWVPMDNEAITGFLFGDAMLFYCATWQPWNQSNQAVAERPEGPATQP